MKATKIFLKFAIYSTITSIMAISTVQVADRLSAELRAVKARHV